MSICPAGFRPEESVYMLARFCCTILFRQNTPIRCRSSATGVRSWKFSPTLVQKYPAAQSGVDGANHTTLNSGILQAVSAASQLGLVCPLHGNSFDDKCGCRYRKGRASVIAVHRVSVSERDRPEVSPTQPPHRQRSGRRKRITVTVQHASQQDDEAAAPLQSLVAYRPAPTTERHSQDRSHIAPATPPSPTSCAAERMAARKRWRTRPLGLVRSLQISAVAPQVAPTHTARTLPSPTQRPSSRVPRKQIHVRFRSEPDKCRVNYCDEEKTQMIIKWLEDVHSALNADVEKPDSESG